MKFKRKAIVVLMLIAASANAAVFALSPSLDSVIIAGLFVALVLAEIEIASLRGEL